MPCPLCPMECYENNSCSSFLSFQELFDTENYTTYVKDAFHRYLINNEAEAICPKGRGTKVAGYYKLTMKPGESCSIRVRLVSDNERPEGDLLSNENFDDIFKLRKDEADDFYSKVIPGIQVDCNFYSCVKW